VIDACRSAEWDHMHSVHCSGLCWTTPAANSSRTPPSRPRALAHSRAPACDLRDARRRASTFTDSRSARQRSFMMILGRDEDLLWELSDQLEPEDGKLWVYDIDGAETPPSPTMASRRFAKLSRIRSIAPVARRSCTPLLRWLRRDRPRHGPRGEGRLTHK